MRKLFILFVFLFCGCVDLSNTPVKRVENFLKEYQVLSGEVLVDLESTISSDGSLTEGQKDVYLGIMKNQYQNMTYKIKEEKIDGDESIVVVEIEVFDFIKVIDDSYLYLKEYPLEFEGSDGDFNGEKFNDFKLENMRKSDSRIVYTIYIDVVKSDEKWSIGSIDEATYEKLNGLYDY